MGVRLPRPQAPAVPLVVGERLAAAVRRLADGQKVVLMTAVAVGLACGVAFGAGAAVLLVVAGRELRDAWRDTAPPSHGWDDPPSHVRLTDASTGRDE